MYEKTSAEFDQAHARIRDAIDGLVDALAMGHALCTCGNEITSQRHTTILVGYIQTQYPPETLPLLLAEAVIRLAIANGAK
ncbi:hypothetical protein D5S18_18470 [Nocardia panacis]|uniref:Uncharacterized protein n=1 Tax=Nocardia panacis TaxID=2340916 RepID=A0A3A4K632_9NOCA|nr:hypothetical protein [Nocardia panacis]RJO74138.1 hypothetical protein D5S18_18470 [Nocardia panacis]